MKAYTEEQLMKAYNDGIDSAIGAFDPYNLEPPLTSEQYLKANPGVIVFSFHELTQEILEALRQNPENTEEYIEKVFKKYESKNH